MFSCPPFHAPSPTSPRPQLNLISHLSLNCRRISGWAVFTEIFKALKSVNIHNINQKVILKNNP